MEKIERDLAALVRVLALRDATEQVNQPRADGDR
jgi:hypothetical protein